MMGEGFTSAFERRMYGHLTDRTCDQPGCEETDLRHCECCPGSFCADHLRWTAEEVLSCQRCERGGDEVSQGAAVVSDRQRSGLTSLIARDPNVSLAFRQVMGSQHDSSDLAAGTATARNPGYYLSSGSPLQCQEVSTGRIPLPAASQFAIRRAGALSSATHPQFLGAASGDSGRAA